MKPNFLVIGAGRSGSTWIHECLKEHPEVLVPHNIKEIHFFNRNPYYQKGIEWYESFFDPYNGEKAIGEVTPSYLSDSSSEERIYKHYPDIRLIATLRNLVDRAHSCYVGHIMSGRVARNENIFIATERLDKIDTQIYFNRAGIIEQGFYYKQLQRYLKFFPRNQILVLLYDELKENPVYYIQKIFSFLKVDESFIRSVIDKRINVDIYSESLRLINRTGRKLGKICPKFQYYLELLVLRLRKKYVKKKQPGMDINIRMKLIDIYRDDIVELAKFLEKGLSVWLKAEKKGIKQ